MKYHLLLLTLITMILGIESSSKNPSQAKPAPIFNSIIEDVRTQIPSGLKIRLPAFIPNTDEDVTLYSFIPRGELDWINLGSEDLDTFMVLVSQMPDCQTQKKPSDCIFGIIGVSETTSDSELKIDDLPENVADITPVELNESAQGFYFIQDKDYQLVVWKQDDLAHLLITEKCGNDCVLKQDLIDMAISAANEPAITNNDSSYYSY